VLPKVNDLVRADQKLKDLCMRRVSAKFVPQLMTARAPPVCSLWFAEADKNL